MTIILSLGIVVCIVILVAIYMVNQSLTKRAEAAERQAELARQNHETEVSRIYADTQASLAQSQKLVDQQAEDLKREVARVRQHYLNEARKIQAAANASVAKTRAELEPLRKYQSLKVAETEVQRQLAAALQNATALRAEANALLAQSRSAAAEERGQAKQRSQTINEQADARLDQAIRDAGICESAQNFPR